MKLTELRTNVSEGWFSSKKTVKNATLTPEERKLIKRIFSNSNVDLVMANGEPVFDSNAHAFHGRARLSFYKKGDELRVSVAHHSSNIDAMNPSVASAFHTDHAATEDELERIKRDIS